MFCHFSKRRWTFEIFCFGKSVLFLCITSNFGRDKYFFDFQLTLVIMHLLFHDNCINAMCLNVLVTESEYLSKVILYTSRII